MKQRNERVSEFYSKKKKKKKKKRYGDFNGTSYKAI